ncbi:unnamed protein product [Staurois parvus]|uniref:Uncharacterized protein n=1 Tax=Staurois parvus TaxID=386267 RepID=A0ABN9G6P6_9NEOB|nr:unnamed protein product [Staurois parvus]
MPPDWSGSFLGPVKVPRRLREQGGGQTSGSLCRVELSQKWERVPVKTRYPLPPKGAKYGSGGGEEANK